MGRVIQLDDKSGSGLAAFWSSRHGIMRKRPEPGFLGPSRGEPCPITIPLQFIPASWLHASSEYGNPCPINNRPPFCSRQTTGRRTRLSLADVRLAARFCVSGEAISSLAGRLKSSKGQGALPMQAAIWVTGAFNGQRL